MPNFGTWSSIAQYPVGKPVVKHGTRAQYNLGCRCEPCRDVKRKKLRKILKNTPTP